MTTNITITGSFFDAAAQKLLAELNSQNPDSAQYLAEFATWPPMTKSSVLIALLNNAHRVTPPAGLNVGFQNTWR